VTVAADYCVHVEKNDIAFAKTERSLERVLPVYVSNVTTGRLETQKNIEIIMLTCLFRCPFF